MNNQYMLVTWTWPCPCGKTHRTIIIGDAGSTVDDALAIHAKGRHIGIHASKPHLSTIDIDELDAMLSPELGIS